MRVFKPNPTFCRLQKLWNLAIICPTTELVRGVEVFQVWRLKLICIAVSLCKHACKAVCDVKPELHPCPLLTRSWDRWRLDFVTFTTYKKSQDLVLKGAKTSCAFRTGAKIKLTKKIFSGARCTLTAKVRSIFTWTLQRMEWSWGCSSISHVIQKINGLSCWRIWNRRADNWIESSCSTNLPDSSSPGQELWISRNQCEFTDRLAQFVEHRTIVREVTGWYPGRTNTQGL